ncbi:hypothetical protein TcasGA2_TC016417 [Tribolium castaneum]|uniref:Sushi domain-containing protein n=1 Tax=Tribolium castaneum TaxID=7070 RepID=D7GY21_TRICA|nr:hypothetical protein TcasGA2_TC016417 [Tribolium castaneum]
MRARKMRIIRHPRRPLRAPFAPRRAQQQLRSRAIFSCAWGYRLMGPPGIECQLNRNWSGPLAN